MSSEFVTIRVVLAQPDPAKHDSLVPAIVQGGLDEVFGVDASNDEEAGRLGDEIEGVENVEAIRPRVK